MLLAAMGPGRSEAPPDATAPPPVIEYDLDANPDTAMSPEEAAAQAEPVPVPELQIVDAQSADPAEYQWVSRLVVVFADTPNDPAFVDQMRALRTRPEPLIERDVVVIPDTDPDAASPWRARLHPRGFSLVLIDKDGQVKQRKPAPWDVREISRAIDKFPLRRQEIGRGDLGE
ncbi:DUF4174 domain-containing protein [Paracoccus albicereus]